jgi:hypothetical protein
MTGITSTLHEDVFTFMAISRRILLRMRNFYVKSRRENKRHIFSNFFPENRAFYEKMSKNVVEPERPQTTI